MFNKADDVTAKAVLEFTRNGLKTLAEKYGGDCTLNEVRVMIQIIRCYLEGRTCSVTALHKVTGIPIPTVSRSVGNLQSDGWLSEQRDPNDGRKRLITFGPRSLEQTPTDLMEAIQWFNDFREQGLAT